MFEPGLEESILGESRMAMTHLGVLVVSLGCLSRAGLATELDW